MNTLVRWSVTALMLCIGIVTVSAKHVVFPAADPGSLVECGSLEIGHPEAEFVVIDLAKKQDSLDCDLFKQFLLSHMQKQGLSQLDEQSVRTLLHEFAPILAEAIKRGTRAAHAKDPESIMVRIKKAVKNAAIACVWPVTKKKILILSLVYSLTYATFLFVDPLTARYYTGQAFATLFPLVGNALLMSGKLAGAWMIEATKFGVRFILPEGVNEAIGQSFALAMDFFEKAYAWYPGVAPVVG